MNSSIVLNANANLTLRIQAVGSTFTAYLNRGKVAILAYSFEDVNGDGFMDLVSFFSVPELVMQGALTETTTQLTLTAALYDGTPIEGTDSVRVVPP